MLALKQRAIKVEYPRFWVPALHNMVMRMQSDIHTVEALCAALAQDDTDAGRVLEKLFEFLPRSIRVDGAIWKSDAYWWTDHRISRAKMKRIRKNLLPIVESWKQNAQGAPTWHYRLDHEALITGIGQVYNRTPTYVRVVILQNGCPENDAQGVKTSKSITSDSESDSDIDSIHSNSKTVTEIEFALIAEGLTMKAASEFTGMNILTVRRVIEAAQEKDRAGQITKSKAGYIVGALRKESGRAVVETVTADEFEGSAALPDVAKSNPLDAIESQVDEQYLSAWNAAKEQLRFQLDRNTFNTWLADVRVIDYTGGVFVLAVRNEFALEMLEGRLRKSVRRLLRDASGADVDVRFVTLTGSASLTTPDGRPNPSPSGRGE